jgi:hypothetical protein
MAMSATTKAAAKATAKAAAKATKAGKTAHFDCARQRWCIMIGGATKRFRSKEEAEHAAQQAKQQSEQQAAYEAKQAADEARQAEGNRTWESNQDKRVEAMVYHEIKLQRLRKIARGIAAQDRREGRTNLDNRPMTEEERLDAEQARRELEEHANVARKHWFASGKKE